MWSAPKSGEIGAGTQKILTTVHQYNELELRFERFLLYRPILTFKENSCLLWISKTSNIFPAERITLLVCATFTYRTLFIKSMPSNTCGIFLLLMTFKKMDVDYSYISSFMNGITTHSDTRNH